MCDPSEKAVSGFVLKLRGKRWCVFNAMTATLVAIRLRSGKWMIWFDPLIDRRFVFWVFFCFFFFAAGLSGPMLWTTLDGCRMFETTINMLYRIFKEVYAFKIEYSSLMHVSPSVPVAYSEYCAARKQWFLQSNWITEASLLPQTGS